MNNTTNAKPINPATRLGSMVLDHFFMTMIATGISIPGFIFIFISAFDVTHEQEFPNFMEGPWGYINLFGFTLYFCKDCINGRSIAKRIIGLQIVDAKTGEAASPIRCFVRNLSMIFWPIEGIVALTNTSQRLGDRIAGTKLVEFDKNLPQPKINIMQVAVPVVFSYGLLLLIMLPFQRFLSMAGGEKIAYVETSYNAPASRNAEKHLVDSLSDYATVSVKVYDQIQNKPAKYVSVIFNLKDNYLNTDQNFENIKSLTVPLLISRFPTTKWLGKIKYVYQTSTSTQIRTIRLEDSAEKEPNQ